MKKIAEGAQSAPVQVGMENTTADHFTQQYQWIKTEKTGIIEKSTKSDNDFLYFESGNRIKHELLPELMVNINNEDTKVVYVDPDTMHHDPIDKPINQEKVATKNPLISLLQKNKDNVEKELEILIDINIPKTETIKVLTSSFGDSETTQALVEFIRNQLTDNITTKVDECIIEFINKYKNL